MTSELLTLVAFVLISAGCFLEVARFSFGIICNPILIYINYFRI